MALFVNTNHSALRAMGDLSGTQRSLSDTFRKISSGQRVNRAADDAAGLAVAENLDAKESSARVATSSGESRKAISLPRSSGHPSSLSF